MTQEQEALAGKRAESEEDQETTGRVSSISIPTTSEKMTMNHHEQEAVAELHSLSPARSKDDQSTGPPCTVNREDKGPNSAVEVSQVSKPPMEEAARGGQGAPIANLGTGSTELDNTVASMRQLTEMLLKNRPVVDPLKNQGYDIVSPHQHDILSGRGNGANQHPGNIFFRNLIHKYKHHYIHTGPSEKKLITKKIVEEVQQLNPPGRFLKKNHETELWDCLDIDKVLKKTGEILRETAPELKKRACEEQKTRITWSSESYIQNSRQTGDSHVSAPSTDMELYASAVSPNTPMNLTDQDVSSVNALRKSGVGDLLSIDSLDFNDGCALTFNSTAKANNVELAHQKKAEKLIATFTSPDVTLCSIFDQLRQNTSTLPTVMSNPLKVTSLVPRRKDRGGFNQLQPAQQESNVQISMSIPSVATPHHHDVIFYNGAVVTSHPGSNFFWEQVNQMLPQYKGSTVNTKQVEWMVINSIGARSPPGRFLCTTNMSMIMNKNLNK